MTLQSFRPLLMKLTITAALGVSFAANAANGLTWIKKGVDDVYGVVTVGCDYTLGHHCDPYSGDTPCGTKRPVLCFHDAWLPKPANLVTSSYYNEWSGGVVATTKPVAGNKFAHISEANAFCEKAFGTGWRVAEHHDGGAGYSGAGWNFMAYGNVGNNADITSADGTKPGFWIDIDDQPYGTCWTH